MRLPRFLRAGTAFLLTIAAADAQAYRESAGSAALEIPLAYETYREAAARAAFAPAAPASDLRGRGPAPVLQIDPFSGRVRMAYGGDLRLAAAPRSDAAAAALAGDFLRAHPDAFGVREDNAELRSVTRRGGKVAVHYRQVLDGLPVWAASAFVLCGPDGRIAASGSGFVPEPDGGVARATLSAEAATAVAAAALRTVPRADRPVLAEPILMPAPAGDTFAPAPAYRVVFESAEPFGKWESFVHGVTGDLLGRRNLYFPLVVSGDTRGSTAANPPTYGWCDGYSPYPYEHVTVTVEDATGQSDARGDFDVIHFGAAPVEASARLAGPWCDVHRMPHLGPDAAVSVVVANGHPVTLLWDGANSRRDERTTFYHTNLAHDFLKAIDPDFTRLDYSMHAIVGREDGFCPGNAWWDGIGTNYCAPGDGAVSYYNTGTLGNVIYHEYGHGVTQELYVGNGEPEPPSGLHEGNSDAFANFIDRNPVIGYGFSSATGCNSGIRNADNTLTYPSDNETGAHRAGQVMAGFHWLAWQGMLAALPAAAADEAAFRTWHEGRMLGTPRTFPDQVLWTFLADDDDAVLTNGTPHHEWLCAAAEAKGFECPEVFGPIDFVTGEMPHVTDGSAGFDLTATITSSAAAIDPAAVFVHWRVNGGPFADLAMTPTGAPDGFAAHLGAVPGNSAVEYWFEAWDTAGNSGSSPRRAPDELHVFDVAHVVDDLEGGASGWTAGALDDDALSGWWDLFDPVGTEAQPEDDATPGSGSLCFITGQCAAGEGGCTTSCQLSCNDVDGGRTVLFTPVYDLSGAEDVALRYSRWFSADRGAVTDDAWVVDASNDGGATWTNAVTTAESRAAWVEETVDVDALFGAADRVQLRFVASDLGEGSVVEAGVDDLRIFARYGAATSAPALPPPPAALALTAIRPNPFADVARIEFATPRAGNVTLAVYDVRGRRVRLLAAGTRAAGAHREAWDGRDASGDKAAPGVYFVRLTAGGESRTAKVVARP